MRPRYLATAIAVALLPFPASAQRQTDRLLLPVPSLVRTDDATSLVVNPANLAFLESYSFHYVHGEILRTATPILGRGDGVYLASPLLFGAAMALGYEYLRPPPLLGLASRGAFSTGLAFRLGLRSALGMSFRLYDSAADQRLDGLATWDAALTLRPWTWLSVAAAVRDLNAPNYGGRSIPRTWVGGIGLRPTGRDDVQLSAELAVDEREGRVTPSGSIAVAVPWVGELRAGIELPEDPDGPGREVRAQVALEVTTSRIGAGSALSTRGDALAGWSAYARVSGERYRGLARPARVVAVPVEGALDLRATTKLARALDQARQDCTVQGVLLRVRGATIGFSVAQEIRRRVQALQRSGRPVVCHLDDASGNAYAMCSAADNIMINPAGGIRLIGVRSQAMYFRGLLDHLGVRAQFVRIGEYKSAPEAFERTGSSEPARRALDAVLNDYADQLVSQISHDRNIEPEAVRTLIDQGPYVAPEAVRAQLADAMVYEDQIDLGLRQAFGRPVNLVEQPSSPPRPRRWGTPGRIAVIYVEGTIVDGRSFNVPLLDMQFAGGRTISDAVDEAASDPTVAAIVLRIDSPGGSALASDLIWRAVFRARQRKPVVASMQSVAASGGYYIASAATEIVADPSTLTGSIGIFFGKLDLSGLLDRVGITVETFRRGRRADFESMYRSWTADEERMIRAKIRHFYNVFLRKVARGRRMSVEQVDVVGRGRIWSGRQARALHLVDSYGGISEALWRARTLGDLPEDYELVELPPAGGLLETLLGLMGVGAQQPNLRLPLDLRRSLRAAAPLLYSDPSTPLAVMPIAIEPP